MKKRVKRRRGGRRRRRGGRKRRSGGGEMRRRISRSILPISPHFPQGTTSQNFTKQKSAFYFGIFHLI
jgi:hypothetical protein